MPVLFIRYQVAERSIPEVTSAVKAAFAAIEAAKPAGIRYAYYRKGTELIGLVELDEGIENPLLGIPAARELQAAVARNVLGEPPAPQPLEVLGSYGF